MTDIQEQKRPSADQKETPKVFSWVLFAEMGAEFAGIIAAPLIIFVFLSQLLALIGLHDAAEWIRLHKQSPAFNAAGIMGAIIISFLLITKKIISIKKILDKQ